MNRTHAINAVRNYIAQGQFEADLRHRVAYPSVSQDDALRAQTDAYLSDIIEPELGAMGFVCTRVANPIADAPPFLIAHRFEADDLPTVLTYGHGDVVAGHEGRWSEGLSPWEITFKDGAWYGRGTADNKGQHLINFAALRHVIQARDGKLGYNLKILFEQGEERGSPGIREVCTAHQSDLAADVFLASDGPRVAFDQPTLFLGSRGQVVFELACTARETGLHSGNWGGIMSNPAIVLTHAIGALVDAHGRIRVSGLLPPPLPESVRAALSTLPIDSAHLGRELSAGWGEPGLTAAERLLGWNTLEVLTLHSGNPDKPVNAIPPSANAYCQLRFVVGTDWTALEQIVRAHLDEAGFEDVTVRVLRGSPATRLDPSDPWVQWASQSIQTTLGKAPAIMPNLGGTVPNDAFADILGLPTIWVPHSYPNCKQHAPNEHLPRAIAEQGLEIMAGLFWDLGSGITPARTHTANGKAEATGIAEASGLAEATSPTA